MLPPLLDLELSGIVTVWRIDGDWCFRSHHTAPDALENAMALKALNVAATVYIGHVPPVFVPCSEIFIDAQPQG